MRRFCFYVLLWSWSVVFLPGAVTAQTEPVTLRVACWNMESGESSDSLLRKQMAAKEGISLWGLSEVRNQQALGAFEQGAESGEDSDFSSILGTTGGADRLAIIFDAQRLELIGEPEELAFVQVGNPALRAPLVAHFKGRKTGQEFLFMVNHLKRGGAQNSVRIQQSRLLNRWARTQSLPIVASGDYNYDYDVENGHLGAPHRDRGFDELTRDGVFIWIEPTTLVKTQALPSTNSVLDFIFVHNPPFGWSAESHILEQNGDEPATTNAIVDNQQTTDHRPVDAILTFHRPGKLGGAPLSARGAAADLTDEDENTSAPSAAETQEIRREIETLRRRLAELERRLGDKHEE